MGGRGGGRAGRQAVWYELRQSKHARLQKPRQRHEAPGCQPAICPPYLPALLHCNPSLVAQPHALPCLQRHKGVEAQPLQAVVHRVHLQAASCHHHKMRSSPEEAQQLWVTTTAPARGVEGCRGEEAGEERGSSRVGVLGSTCSARVRPWGRGSGRAAWVRLAKRRRCGQGNLFSKKCNNC